MSRFHYSKIAHWGKPGSVLGTALCFSLVSNISMAGLTVDGNFNLRSHWVDRDIENQPAPYSDVDKDHEFTGHVNTLWERSPYQVLNSQFGVAMRRTDLGDPRKGTRVSRANVSYTDGVSEVPYVVEAGDFFAQHSSRSLRRNLKGAQIEFQPQSELRQSIQLLAGIDSTEWDTAGDASRYLAFSWLAEHDRLGGVTLGHVFSEDSDHAAEQRTTAVAWNNSIRFGEGHHQIEWEAEWLQHGNERNDGHGVFASVYSRLWQGKTRIQLGYELNDKDFNPRGGVSSAGQRRWDASLHQRTKLGNFSASFNRLNFFAAQSEDTSMQIAYSRSFFQRINLNISIGKRDSSSPFGDNNNENLSTSLNWSLSDSHALQLTGSQSEDSSTSDFGAGVSRSDTKRRDVSIGWRSSGHIGGGQWSVAPKISWRENVSDSGDSEEISPGISFGLRQGPHDLQLNYDSSQSETSNDSFGDSEADNYRLNARYSYQQERTRWSIELGEFVSDGSLLDQQTEHTVLLSVDHRFQYRSETSSNPRAAIKHEFSPVDPLLALTHLVGDGEFAVAHAVILSANPSSQIDSANQSIFTGQFLPGEFEEQTLEIERRHGQLAEVRWSVNLEGKSPREVARIFERTRTQLYANLGEPFRREEFGRLDEFSDGELEKAINSNALVLLNEWQVNGNTLRFGIPRSLDGKTKLRIYFQPKFSNGLEDSWG